MVFLPILFLSCGIQTYSYIGGAIVDATGTFFKIQQDYGESKVNKFSVFTRYFYDEGNRKETVFEDLTLSDTNDDSEAFLLKHGFTKVSFMLNPDETDVEERLQDYINVNSNQEYEIPDFDNTEAYPVHIKYHQNGFDFDMLYPIKCNYKDKSGDIFSHYIGIYDDDENEGKEFLDAFISDNNLDDDISALYVEFAIVNYGFNSGYIESLPVYYKYTQVQR